MPRTAQRARPRFFYHRCEAACDDAPEPSPTAGFFGPAILLTTAILTVSSLCNGASSPHALTLSPSSLSFSSQTVGTSSAAQLVTLTNTGTATVKISAIAANGDYSQTNTCGASLAASAPCTISVTFTPTATGTRTGTLSITDNAPGSPQSVGLTGTGASATAPAVTLSPASLSFSSQTIGTRSAAQPVTLTNTGTAALLISSIAASGDYSQTNTCGASLAAGAPCTISVTFTPTATGTRTGTLSITDNAPGSPQSVSLTGTGASATAPAVTLSPASLSFSSQTVGTSSAAQPVTLTNTGTAALLISSIAASGDYSQTNTCGASLAAGAPCTISVTFTPTATGTRTGTLSITDNAPGSPQSVGLTGTGASATAPAVTLSPASLSFSSQTIGTSSAAQPVTLTNTGTAALLISSIAASGDYSQTNTCGASLAASAPCTISVTFTPTATGTRTGTLSITDNAPGSPQSVGLTGTGVAASGVVSDDFHASALGNLWTFVNPLADGSVNLNGFQAVLTVPPGPSHDAWTSGNTTIRLMQNISDGDFQVEVKFDSIVAFPAFYNGSQSEGIIVEQDGTNFLRFDVDCTGQAPTLFSATFVNGTPTVQLSTTLPAGQVPHWLRMSRAGNVWTLSWSYDGTTFTTAVTYTFALKVARIGPAAGNAGFNGAQAPAFSALIDYFFNVASPIVPEDGVILSPNFDRIVIDATAPASVLEKGLADIDGDGRLDAIVGFGQVTLYGLSSPGGIYWYENPHSGVLTDPWLKHTIVASGDAYEALAPYDVNGDGAVDVVASINGALEWFENPKGSGLDPATNPWKVHFIGTGGGGENPMVFADIDGDGKIDIVASPYIFFQNGPDSWTRVPFGGVAGGVALLDIGSGKGAINLTAVTPSPFTLAWFENPRETNGAARTGTWIVHYIGPADFTEDGSSAMVTADLNGDGRMDVVTAQSEGSPPPPGGLILWEAPLDRRNDLWIQHTIDPNYQWAHKIWVADMDGNGTPDIVTAEQEQAIQERVSIFLNDGAGNFSDLVISTRSGHNLVLGDVNGDGILDIFNSAHGYFGFSHVLELFLNRLP